MREYSVKRDSVCFSKYEKGRRDPFYKYSGPALDLIWAVMQTTHTPASTGCSVCVCVSLGGWGIGCQGDSDISGPTPCCPQFSLDKSEKMLSRGPANLQSLSLAFSHSLPLLLIISVFLSLHGDCGNFLFLISASHCTRLNNFSFLPLVSFSLICAFFSPQAPVQPSPPSPLLYSAS